MAVKFVVPIGIVMEHQASGRRVDGDLFDPRNDDEGLFHLLEQLRIALGRRNLHADTARHLVRDLKFWIGHYRLSDQDSEQILCSELKRRHYWAPAFAGIEPG